MSEYLMHDYLTKRDIKPHKIDTERYGKVLHVIHKDLKTCGTEKIEKLGVEKYLSFIYKNNIEIPADVRKGILKTYRLEPDFFESLLEEGVAYAIGRIDSYCDVKIKKDKIHKDLEMLP